MELFIAFSNNVVFLTDSFDFYNRAVNMDFNRLDMWSDGFYPLGYPLLLKVITLLTFDYLIAAKLVSIISSIVLAFVIYEILDRLWGSYFAILGLLLLITNSVFLTYSCTDNTDMLCLSLSFTALYFLIKEDVDCDDKLKRAYLKIFTAGLFVGGAYLIRYTAILVLLSSVLWLFIIKSERKLILLFILGFTLVAWPQLIVSYLLHKDPLWNLQVQNIWFGMYGNMNWGANWVEAGKYNSITSLFFSDPLKFIQNIYNNVVLVFTTDLFKFSIYKLGFLGLILSLLAKGINMKQFLFIIVASLYTLFISMAFVNERVLLVLFPILLLFVFYPVDYFVQLVRNYRPQYLKFLYAFTSLIFFFYLIVNYKNHASKLIFEKLTVTYNNIKKVNYWVHFNEKKIDIRISNKILSFSYEYYDESAKSKKRFDIPWHYDKETFLRITTPENLVSYMKSVGYEYILYDKSLLFNLPAWQLFWNEEKLNSLFSIVYKYNDVTIMFLKKNNNVAGINDFNNFLSTNPFEGINSSSYAQGDQRTQFFRLFQGIGNWNGSEWHKDNILPEWQRYKTNKRLL